MEKLISGVAEFQNNEFVENIKLYKGLALGQEPEVLFITCADSRIDPNLITQTKPGELFIIRNAGNIVPPHSNVAGGVTASVEYAVAVLSVKHIVVCGHTNCGAIKGAMYPESIRSLPHVSNWISNCSAALARVKARHEHPDKPLNDEHLHELTEENVLLQLRHLETHPCVAAALATGSIELHGWLYELATGMVTCYDAAERKFVPIADRYAQVIHKHDQKKTARHS
ncbi:MAG: carbonic anhydrase [Pseudomonadales bacterium]|nr:carbonic anhydrase [Pseudomonadales bacterium]